MVGRKREGGREERRQVDFHLNVILLFIGKLELNPWRRPWLWLGPYLAPNGHCTKTDNQIKAMVTFNKLKILILNAAFNTVWQCGGCFIRYLIINNPQWYLQSRTKVVGTLPPDAVFYFWPISLSSQYCLSQSTHQILHTNIGKARRQQSVPKILTETVGGLKMLACHPEHPKGAKPLQALPGFSEANQLQSALS